MELKKFMVGRTEVKEMCTCTRIAAGKEEQQNHMPPCLWLGRNSSLNGMKSQVCDLVNWEGNRSWG
jgi:hypothetical protein